MPSAGEIIEQARKEARVVLTEMESKQLLRSLGIRTTEMKLATSEQEALALAEEIGYPCALKISSPDITHKSDAGGVKVGLKSAEEVAAAWGAIMSSCAEKFPDAVIEGVTVQNMAPPGLEVIIGMATDPQFGPVLMFAWAACGGASQGRQFQDRAPYQGRRPERDQEDTRREAPRRLSRLRPGRHLVLEDILLRVSDFVMKTPAVAEMDLNPIFAYPDGAIAVDARVILGEL